MRDLKRDLECYRNKKAGTQYSPNCMTGMVEVYHDVVIHYLERAIKAEAELGQDRKGTVRLVKDMARLPK